MKRLIITLTILLAAASAFAEPKSRTVIIRDGKVIEGSTLGFDDLLAGKRAFLGVVLTDLSSELREYFGAPKDSGVLVASVEDNSPADKAGVRVGDVIVAVEGKDIEGSWDLRSALKDKKDGDTARIEVLRGRSRQTLVATLVERDFGPRIRVGNLTDLGARLGETFNSPEWHARVERFQNCDELQEKLKQLESRMKELERKLQK